MAEPVSLRVSSYGNDGELLARVLRPYREQCKYLKQAEVSPGGENGVLVTGRAEFSIPESCYIDDTGHFNSVEFNICYNQMLYYVVAKSVKEAIFAPFYRWSLSDYYERQLPDFLITDFRSSFRRPMQARRFYGQFEVQEATEWEGDDLRPAMIVLSTRCRYWDDGRGDSRGEVKVAITNPPPLRVGEPS